jgi:hypothetical protein
MANESVQVMRVKRMQPRSGNVLLMAGSGVAHALDRLRPVREPFASTPRRIEGEPFSGARHFCDRVRCAVLNNAAARPGRLGE